MDSVSTSAKPPRFLRLRGRPSTHRLRFNAVAAAASEAQARHDWDEARELWRTATELQPRDVNAWLQYGNMLNELARFGDAVSAFRHAGDLDPASLHPQIGVAGVAEREGRWHDAHAAWRAIADAARVGDDAAAVVHAGFHAALSALNMGDPAAADACLRDVARDAPPALTEPYALLQAQILKHRDPASALAILQDPRSRMAEDRSVMFERASICLELGRHVAGLDILDAAARIHGEWPDLLWLKADLAERLGRWDDVLGACLPFAATAGRGLRFLDRSFDAALRLDDLVLARSLALRLARSGELRLIHRLIEPYEHDGQLARARLLCRWCRRRWPHSSWHRSKYILLTARSRSLDVADRETRREIGRHGHERETVRISARAAFVAGSFTEAVRRLRHALEQDPGDEDSAVLLGYAIANADSLGAAETWFAGLASRSFQSRAALVGLAHMAMRLRDRHATYERWLRVATIHPGDDIAHVELARSAYELRDMELVDQICRERLAAAPHDRTMREFQAWFLLATGRPGAAWATLLRLTRTHPSWTVASLMIQAAHAVGRLDRRLALIAAMVPRSTSAEGARRCYELVRQLSAAGRLDLLDVFLGRSRIPPRDMPWLAPYLRATERTDAPVVKGYDPGAVTRIWAEARSRVRGDLCERASRLGDSEIDRLLDRTRADQPVVHLINKFEQGGGGSELHALDVAARLRAHAVVHLWAPEMPHPVFSDTHGVRPIAPADGVAPRGGVVVFVGIYFSIGLWLARVRPSRVIFLYNTFEAPLLFRRIDEVWRLTGLRPELLFCSDMMQAEVDLPGLFEPSPIDIDLFCPAATREAGRPLVLGRHSRDVMEKHHPEDGRIYQAVAKAGGRSRILGGTCMTRTFPKLAGLDLLPARAVGIAPFLQELDIFFYRTSTWIEPWGRVVLEAMACGLPVLVSRTGGYAQAIRHGENGLLFDTTDEALALLRDLLSDAPLRARLGQAARRTVEEVLGPKALRRLVSFYLLDHAG